MTEQTQRRLELFISDQGLRDVTKRLDPVTFEVSHQAVVKL